MLPHAAADIATAGNPNATMVMIARSCRLVLADTISAIDAMNNTYIK
jgi:hypothetical protein